MKPLLVAVAAGCMVAVAFHAILSHVGMTREQLTLACAIGAGITFLYALAIANILGSKS